MNILKIQALLAFLEYDTGGVDGIEGPKTRKAVTMFQKEYGGLAVDGDPGAATQTALREAVADGWERPEAIEAPAPEKTGTIWDESPYFTRAEFGCRCGEYHSPYCNGFPVEPDETLVRLANRVRGHFGRQAIRSSGIRCPQHNADSQGVYNSKHLQGKALDFMIEGKTAAEVLAYVKAQPETNYAYDIDGTYVHMDVK